MTNIIGNSPLSSRRDYALEDQDNKPQDYTEEELGELAEETIEVIPIGWRVPQGDVIAAESVNKYLNTPPTKLKRDIKNTKNKKDRAEMTEALNAWRLVIPGPFRKGSEDMEEIAKEVTRMARSLMAKPSMKDLKDTITNWGSLSKEAKNVFGVCNNFSFPVGGDLQLYAGSQMVASCSADTEEGQSKAFHDISTIKIKNFWVRVNGTKVSINII